MAWPLQNTAHWNPSMGMTSDMNVGPYTVKEWSDMQQHNWQQWAQWQQQYTQWHHQYGDKYAQQYQPMQHMGNVPVLLPMNSVATPVPPPPPPEQPPPPPPHENNQPLFGQPHIQPTPVPPPATIQQSNSSNYSNANLTTGSNQSWSTSKSNIEPPQIGNADALKKLAEEERLFDIQFQKWEEEIDKWRKENVNHPDKQAYKEYEKKFESCRAQLLERRNQMKLKRANLLGSNSHPVIPNKPTVAAFAPKSANKNNYSQVTHSQSYQKSTSQDYSLENNSHIMSQQSSTPQTVYNINKNNKNIDPQDRYESYQNISDNMTSYSSNESYQPTVATTSFLPTTLSSKVIPGLDLVPETDNTSVAYNKQDVIDITDDKAESHIQAPPQQPDYTTISKGINNILGDEKIMNILSMVCSTNTTNVQIPSNPNQNSNFYSDSHYASNQNQNNGPNYLEDKHELIYSNEPLTNRQNLSYDRQNCNYSVQQNLENNSRKSFPIPPQKNIFECREENISQDEYYDHYNRNNLGGEQSSRPLMYENGPSRSVPMSIKPSALSVRPPFQEISGQENVNDNPRGLSERLNMQTNSISAPRNQPPQPKWIDEPLFTPSIIVEYEHKPLRLKARDFIEPVHMFDYNHKSKNSELKKIDFEKEVDELFSKKPLWERENNSEINDQSRQSNTRYFERRTPHDNLNDEYYSRAPPRVDYERRRPDDRSEVRRRDRGVDDHDRHLRQDEFSRDQNRYRDSKREESRDFLREDRDIKRDDRDFNRDDRDYKRDDRDYTRDDRYFRREEKDNRRNDSRDDRRSRERDSRKRAHSYDRESDVSSKILKEATTPFHVSSGRANHVVMIDDLLESPGREMRPEKIVIILRGPPGSGKSYLAKLIRDKEAEHGGAVRIMSIDDYFMQEGEVEEKDPVSGKVVKKPTLKYEYDANLEESYLSSLKRAFKRSLTDGYFSFLIYDAVNEHLKGYADVWNYSRQNGFQVTFRGFDKVYICTMDIDAQACYKRNIHNRQLEEIQVICTRFFPTPSHHIQLDPSTLLQSAAIPDVHMEDVKDDVLALDTQEPEVQSIFTSKWEKMDTSAQLARLDGISKPLRPSQLSMEDYLQLDDWKPNKAKPGKKSVRWADLEERRQQEKMRAIGFVVGQTDWNRMTDPTLGSSALTQTKYIERVRRN